MKLDGARKKTAGDRERQMKIIIHRGSPWKEKLKEGEKKHGNCCEVFVCFT